MNLIKREWKSYRTQTLYWSIGMLALLFISFYKMQGLNTMPGGMESFLDTLPTIFKAMFQGSGEMNTAIGIYRTIHLYVAIALAFHAVLLGASIFAKEETEKTFEFLYVKGIRRYHILSMKILAGISILLLLDFVCVVGICIASFVADMKLSFSALLPYLGVLFMAQLFFFSLALFSSLLIQKSQKAGSIGSGIVFFMFLISMYVKLGGNLLWLEQFSVFHYTDANYVYAHPYISLPILLILFVALAGFLGAQYLHERRDLL